MRASKSNLEHRVMPEARVIVVIATAIGTIVLLHLTLANTASAESVLQKRTTAVEASDRVLFCIEKAEQPSETIALSRFQASRSGRSQTAIVRMSGWATLPGKGTPDTLLAAKCSSELRKLAEEWRFPGAAQSAAFAQSPSAIHQMWRHDSAR
jgi:hypothetical protein